MAYTPRSDDVSLYVVQTNAVPGRENEFNEWYSQRHLRDLLELDGFVGAQRFQVHPELRGATSHPYAFQYLALYEIEGDPAAALKNLSAARAAGMETSPAIAVERHAHIFTPITRRLVKQPK